jgi:hypothetical protein
LHRQRAMASRRLITIVAGALIAIASSALVGCSQTPTAPTPITEPLRLTAGIGQTLLVTGEPATKLTFRLENLTADTLTLTFATSCQINPYVMESSSNAIVYPQDGGWGCASVVTEMILPAFSAAVREVNVIPAPARVYLPGVQILGLPVGDYATYATIDHARHQMRSDTLRFSVQ